MEQITFAQLTDWNSIAKELSQPFPIEAHSYKPISISQNGAWMAFYVDLRFIVEKAQKVLGEKLSWTLTAIDGNNVKATLRIRWNDNHEIVIEDFGYAADSATEPLKSAATDALRRVFSHLGLGRYLYRLPRIFIRGEKTDYGWKPSVNPLDALQEALNGNYSHNDTLFYPPRSAEDTETPTSSGSRPAKSASKTKNRQEWFRFLGLSDEDGDSELLEAFNMTFPVENYSDKQILAFTSLVAPTDEVYNNLMTKQNYLKQVLDEKLGSRK